VDDSYAYLADAYYFGIYDCFGALPVEKVQQSAAPGSYALLPAFPNPFNPTAVLTFQMPVAGNAVLEIFDIAGRSVGADLISNQPDGERWYSPGTHEFHLNGAGLPPGVYIARLKAGGFTQIQKLVLLK